MKIKILEFKAYQGNKCKIQSHNFKKGKWKVNEDFELYKKLISQTPSRFLWHKEYNKEIKEMIK